jgi:Dolichyl-phosphate-mannose-protein mannosyltransferase
MIISPAIAILLFSICFWQGMRGTDDLGYAQIAMSLLRGDQLPSPDSPPYRAHHVARIGLTVPLAAAFFFFGPSSFSMAMLPLLCTVLTALMIVWLGRRFWGGAVGLCAGLLYALLPQTIGLSTFCVPEPIVTLELCIAGALFLTAIGHTGWLACGIELMAGLLIGVAYLTTEVGALMLPVLYLYLLVTGRIRPRDAWLLAGFMLVLGSELTYHAAVHGNPLYRFTLAQSYPDDPMVRATNSVDLAYRLLKAYPSMFVYPSLDFGVIGPLMVVGGLYGIFRWRECSFFVIWAGMLLLFYNFMTASLSHYVALPVAARLLAPACVPLLVLSGKVLVDLWNWAAGRTAAVKHGSRVLFAAGAASLVATALPVMYLNTAPTLTGAISGNAELVAGFLRQETSVALVSDPLSAKAIQFYRRYNLRDSFMGFEAAARLQGDGLGKDLSQPVFVVLNGPLLNEEQITGHLYGGDLSLSHGEREALHQLLRGSEVEVFSAHFQSDRLLQPLLQYGAVRRLLGPYTYRLVQMLALEDPSLRQVRVFRYRNVRREAERFGGDKREARHARALPRDQR